MPLQVPPAVFLADALSQGRMHPRLLVFPWSATVLDLIAQIFRTAFHPALGPVEIDILCRDPDGVRNAIMERAPEMEPLFTDDAGQDGAAPLRWAGRVGLHAHKAPSRPSGKELDALAAGSPFTALVVVEDDCAEAEAIAAELRQSDGRTIPVYLLTGTVLDADADEERLSKREHLARHLHETYRRRRSEALARQGQTERTELPDWGHLEDTYRQANRRAVDLIPTLRLAAGLKSWQDASSGLPCECIDGAGPLETLARIAHQSWRADRELDGWQPSESRDSARKLHTDLVDYDALSEEKKELDREQIRLLAALSLT